MLSRRAIIDHVVIDGVDLKIHRTATGAISFNGIGLKEFIAKLIATIGEGAGTIIGENPWQGALEKLRLRNSRVVLDQEGAGNLTVKIERLNLNGFRTWKPENPGKFDLDATVNGVSFKWRGEARPFADKITLAIDATVNDVEVTKIEKYFGSLGLERGGGVLSSHFKHQVSLHANGRIDWATKGKIEISKADFALAGRGGLRFDAAAINVAARFSVQSDNRIEVTSGGSVVMGRVRVVTPDDRSIAIKRLTVDVANLVGKILPDGTMQATMIPRLVAQGAKLDGLASARINRIDLRMSRFGLKNAAKALSLRAVGKASMKGVAVAVPAMGQNPAADVNIRSLSVPIRKLSLSLSLTGGAPRWRTVFSLAIKNLTTRIARGDTADVRLRTLTADDVRVDQKLAVVVKRLLLGGLNARLSDKILPGMGTKQPDIPVEAANEGAAGDISLPWRQVRVSISRLALMDRGDVQIRDASVAPAVDFKLALERLDLKNLDTGNTQRRSDLRLKARINEFTELDLSGWATLFRRKPDFDLKLSLKGLELPRFSPYVARAAGMNVDSGQLNLDMVAIGKQSALDLKLDVNLRNLELGMQSPEVAKKLSEAIGMPVQTAIGLLQDSDKAINLQIPVGGTISDPEVDLGDAVQKAVGGALVSLFPPTAIASMLMSASKGAATFAPIPFQVGTAMLDEAGETTARNLAQFLARRPKLSLRVCGRATRGDVEQYKTQILEQQKIVQRLEKSVTSKATKISKASALTVGEIFESAKNPLAKLALDRTRSVRNFLLAQDKNLKGRVSECRSVYNPKDKTPPRAEVTL
ncbi:MAG: DUF748 domain-containing protein [Proteobacteria bacterium]|nr:DUF748 domain-containing protein [Pseudomonadota bacterium]